MLSYALLIESKTPTCPVAAAAAAAAVLPHEGT